MNGLAEVQQTGSISPADNGAWRIEVDESCRAPVGFFLLSSVFWLLAGSALALIASIKMHTPGFLSSWEILTFGHVRPAHLNTIAYGWGAMAGVGVLLWLQARLCRVKLPLPGLLVAGCAVWNLAVAGGTIEIMLGRGTSVEWLEFPFIWSLILAAVFAVVMVVSFMMLASRRTHHIYVSQWYLFGAVVWFPFLFLMAITLIHNGFIKGVTAAATNWWFAHNVLGLFLTPIGIATIYYLMPKVLGKPVHSYHLSLLGFWTLALFYNWAGTHHLIGGPLPAWLVTVGVVGSMMMFIPVSSVAVNHHMTMRGNFHRLKDSVVLRFLVLGGMSYTVVSVQGSLTSLRVVSETSHFTHYTIGHAHLGVYAFFSFAMFAALYYVLPRLFNRSWSSLPLIKLHFWAATVGVMLYWIDLTVMGWVQGMMLNQADTPFLSTVTMTVPHLWVRTLSGISMTVAHLVFGYLVVRFLLSSANQVEGSESILRSTQVAEVQP